MAGTTRSESRRLAFGIVAAGFLAALPLGPASRIDRRTIALGKQR